MDARKSRTEAELARFGIPVNQWLPRVENESEVRLRTADAVARRVIVLHGLGALAHGVERSGVVNRLKSNELWQFLAPSEVAFAQNASPSDRDRVTASWRVEAIWVFLWALGYVDELDLPVATCDMEKLHALVPAPERWREWITSARLRSASEILDETDRAYRIHWAVRDAELNGGTPPAGLHPGVVYERHFALNWLVCYADDWDDITTDT